MEGDPWAYSVNLSQKRLSIHELLIALVPQKKWALKKLGQLQPHIRENLRPGETVTCIEMERIGMGPAVDTDARVLVFYSGKSGLEISLEGDGLSWEIKPDTVLNDFKCIVRHPEIFEKHCPINGPAERQHRVRRGLLINYDDATQVLRQHQRPD